MTPTDLAKILHDAYTMKTGRKPPVVSIEHRMQGVRGRATVLDVLERLRRRGYQVKLQELEVSLVKLVELGALYRREGGFSIVSLEALSNIFRTAVPVGQPMSEKAETKSSTSSPR